MHVLFTPWRYPYLTAPKSPSPPACIFCIAADDPERRETLTLFRGTQALVMMNRYPYTNGHLMVAPIAHVPSFEDLGDDDLVALSRAQVRALRAIRAAYSPDGVNLGVNIGRAAGAGIPGHLHFHIVPRWNGDHNFMNAVAHVKVIPQALEELHGELQKALRSVR